MRAKSTNRVKKGCHLFISRILPFGGYNITGHRHLLFSQSALSSYMYVSALALSLPLLLLLLSTLLSHLGLTTAPHSMLVSLLCVWASSSGLSTLPRAS